jgi:hypothetical protein
MIKNKKDLKRFKAIGEEKLKAWDKKFSKGEFKRGKHQKAFKGNLQYFKIKKLCKLPIIFENMEKFSLEILVLKKDSSESDEDIQEIIDLRPKISPLVKIKAIHNKK